MNNIEHDYLRLLKDILDNGVEKQDRTGTGTRSVFGRQIRHKMSEGFPLLTTKKMPFKTMVTELIWFLQGNTNIKYLVDNGCNIWTGDAYKNYCKNADEGDFSRKWLKLEESFDGFFTNQEYSLYTQEEFINKIKTDDEFAKKWGELGPVYGKQWRRWTSASLEEQWGYGKIDGHPIGGKQYGKFNNNIHIDQIANLINELKTNPDSRRLMVNAWNVGELDQMVLPPCHYGFQVYTRELSIEEKKKIHGLLFEEWETARNNFQNYAMKVTYGEPKDIQYNNEQANHWDSIHKKLAEQIKQIPTRAISLMWNQRSVDTFLGLPFNIASYGLLLTILAKEVNMIPDELIGNLGDVHLYSNHLDQAKEQITREPMKLPELYCLDEYHYLTDEELVGPIPFDEKIEKFRPDFFTMHNYESHPHIKAPLSN